jgi:hypothetical protein
VVSALIESCSSVSFAQQCADNAWKDLSRCVLPRKPSNIYEYYHSQEFPLQHRNQLLCDWHMKPF